MRRALSAAVLSLVACTTTKQVLFEGPSAPITSCDSVWLRGFPGAACDFEGSCERETDDSCCTGFAACRDGMLVMDRTCACTNTACETDDQCAYAITLCDGSTCVECPSVDDCPACPAGFERRTRNGCETCTCTPPSQCALDVACDRVPEGTCYAGQACEPGCTAADRGCCANVCAAAGCSGPAPLGCMSSQCAPPCGICVTTSCDCFGGAWRCAVACVEDARPLCTYE